ncbi:MAG TPA: MFS transporter [Candidatus Sulfotelmatobacter sp.]|nr:MFS transporter [Candidatus Sulfotelmatobacter sp.]
MSTTTVTTGEHHPTAWYAGMKPKERTTFWACLGGWVLDAMDVQMFSFAIPAIIASFAISNAEAGLIGTATLLSSAFGGWFAGALSDRFGRVRTLQITIAWFALFTFLCGFATSYATLFAFRALMGLGFGGEWAAAAVLIGEVISAEHRGKAVGAMQSGWAVGWGIAALMATGLFSLLPQEMAWRALFWVGLTPALLVLFVRRFVDEPAVFARTQGNFAAAGKKPNFLEIFSPSTLRTTLLACLLTTGAQGGYYAITTWLPTFLRTERKLSVLGSGGYLAVIIAGSLVGYLISAWLSDRLGRRLNFILFALCSIATVVLYTQLAIDNTTMLYLGVPLGFIASGIFSGMGPFLTELFPTRIRGSGQGFAYNFGRGIAALNPWFVGKLSATLALGQSIGVFAVIAYGLLILAALALPETRGRELTADT